MRVSKTVIQNIPDHPELDFLLDHFRQMINHCIHIGIEKNLTSRFKIQNEVWYQLRDEYYARYILTAVEKATAILKNYRKVKRKKSYAKTPYVTKSFLSIPYVKIEDGKLRVPIRPREWMYIQLNDHTLEVLSEPSLKVGSALLTRTKLSINYSKDVAVIKSTGQIGIDRNLDNVTIATSKGQVQRYDLSEATKVKAAYREVKSHLIRNDVRIRRQIFRKYGVKQTNKVKQILHRVSKDIVEKAVESKLGIVVENIKGIRKLYRKGNSQGRNYRARMNSWSYYEIQRQIEYKAKWEGIPVEYVDARGTSKYCSICGSTLYPNGQRKLWCPECKIPMDRDVNAARNILARGLRFGPDALPSERMKQSKDVNSMAVELTQTESAPFSESGGHKS